MVKPRRGYTEISNMFFIEEKMSVNKIIQKKIYFLG